MLVAEEVIQCITDTLFIVFLDETDKFREIGWKREKYEKKNQNL